MLPKDPAVRRDAKVISVVSLAHGYSHFSQLLTAPLFPWLKDAFGLSYAELGLLMTVFFVVSATCQAIAGFVVDRFGALPVMLGALALFLVGAAGLAFSTHYLMLLVFSALAGLGNAPFHPIDYSILNAKVQPQRLGLAYAVHGIAGSLGWALAPVLMVGIATLVHWRVAFAVAALMAAVVLLVVWWHRELLSVQVKRESVAAAGTDLRGESPAGESFAFLRLPAVWMSFAFFVTYSVAFGGVQSFGPEAARSLHDMPVEHVAFCLTAYMLASAVGMFVGGLIMRTPRRADRVIGLGFGAATLVALLIGLSGLSAPWVPVLFALMGFGSGIAGPSRDLLVKAAAPAGATGRVYGMVYSGLDVGMIFAPAVYGMLMDAGQPAMVWVGIAAFQGLMILSVLKLGHTVHRRSASPSQAAA